MTSPVPTPLRGEPSPWAGLSGAGVFANGLLIAVIIVDERGGYSGDRLSAAPVHRLASDPAFRARVTAAGGGLSGPGQVESVELDGFLTPLHRRASRRGSSHSRSPATLLRPELGVVDFHGHGELTATLTQWCADGELGVGVRLLTGPGLADDLPDDADTHTGEADDSDDDPNPLAGAPATEGADRGEDRPAVYGDAAYGAGKLLARLEAAGAQIFTKVQPPTAPDGRFAKDRFTIDLDASTVTCPNAVTVAIRPAKAGGGTAVFGAVCAACPLAALCTGSAAGRTIAIGCYEAELARARTAQADPAWVADYKATRPKVERKIAHMMRRRHGGRRARVRGMTMVAADFSLLAAAVNVARLGALGLRRATGPGWQVVPA